MRRKIPLLALLVLLPSFLFSQVGKTVIVEAGTKVTDYFTQKEHYRYPGYVQGEVFFKNGKSNKLLRNHDTQRIGGCLRFEFQRYNKT